MCMAQNVQSESGETDRMRGSIKVEKNKSHLAFSPTIFTLKIVEYIIPALILLATTPQSDAESWKNTHTLNLDLPVGPEGPTWRI